MPSKGLLTSNDRRERLALQELLEPGGAHLPADAGLLVAAERAVGAEVHAAVDREGAGPDAARHRQARSSLPNTAPDRP